jgi:hypothetical protein
MTRSIVLAGAVLLAAVLPAQVFMQVSTQALAQAQPDPDWPCIQRKVPTISAGAVWNGPRLPPGSDWDKDFEAAALAQTLASRRTSLDDVDGILDAFVAKAGAEKDRRLTNVFAGVLELVNNERDRVLDGIDRYARGQQRLAARIRGEAGTLGQATDSPMTEVPAAMKDVASAVKWDTRIFDERRRSLTYVCEVPVILEKRVFEIGRKVQDRL